MDAPQDIEVIGSSLDATVPLVLILNAQNTPFTYLALPAHTIYGILDC